MSARWDGCTDNAPCGGDTCNACIDRRSAARREEDGRHHSMRRRPGQNPLYLLSAFTLRNPVVAWAIRRGLSDERVDYQVQSDDFGDAVSRLFAERIFRIRVESDPRRMELRR